jgi:myo-inositol-1(or 4)-monophosphatase
MAINYEELCSGVIEISRKAGKFILEETKRINREHIETKGTHNYVTYVDKNAEKIIIEGLREILPEAGFIAEENTIETEKKDLMWIIDPLDGTTNFIHGLPCFSVSIALMHHNEPVIGVIYDINLDECFYAWEGGPALMNGNPIRVSNAPELKDSLLATGFPYYDYSLLDKYMELFTWCLKNTHGVRRIGSAAIDLAWVACGRFEAFFEYGLNAWDVAAGVLIIKQAGGRIGDFKGGDDYIFGREIIATNSLIYDKFLAKTKEFLS